MCFGFFCCQTRFSLVIYMLITTYSAFIFGIFVISNFGSNTDIYKYVIIKHEIDEKKKQDPLIDVKDLEEELNKLKSKESIQSLLRQQLIKSYIMNIKL